MTSPYAPPHASSAYPSASSSCHSWDIYATTCLPHPNSVRSAGQDSSWALGKQGESLQRVYFLAKLHFCKESTTHAWLTFKSGYEIQSDHVKCYSAVREHSWFWTAWSKCCTGGWYLSGLLRVFLSWSCLASSFHTPCTYKHQDPTPQRYTSLSSSPKPSWSLKWKCQFHVWCMFYFKMKHKSRHCPWRQNFPFVCSIIVLG